MVCSKANFEAMTSYERWDEDRESYRSTFMDRRQMNAIEDSSGIGKAAA